MGLSEANNGNVKIAKALLRRGVSAGELKPDQVANLVEKAVSTRDPDMVSLLLARGATAFCDCGEAVRNAASAGLADILDILATVGCPLQEPAQCKSMAIHLAARSGHTQVVRVLQKHSCSI